MVEKIAMNLNWIFINFVDGRSELNKQKHCITRNKSPFLHFNIRLPEMRTARKKFNVFVYAEFSNEAQKEENKKEAEMRARDSKRYEME